MGGYRCIFDEAYRAGLLHCYGVGLLKQRARAYPFELVIMEILIERMYILCCAYIRVRICTIAPYPVELRIILPLRGVALLLERRLGSKM